MNEDPVPRSAFNQSSAYLILYIYSATLTFIYPFFKTKLAIHHITYWRKSYKMLVQKPEGKKPIARQRHKWEKINMDPTEICCTYECGLD